MNRYKQREDSSPLPGAAYIRFSSEIQSDSFSLDAQLRQIKEQAERNGVEIIKVFADPVQSAYRKKFRLGINAMCEAARRGEFKVLYVHKVDRLDCSVIREWDDAMSKGRFVWFSVPLQVSKRYKSIKARGMRIWYFKSEISQLSLRDLRWKPWSVRTISPND